MGLNAIDIIVIYANKSISIAVASKDVSTFIMHFLNVIGFKKYI